MGARKPYSSSFPVLRLLSLLALVVSLPSPATAYHVPVLVQEVLSGLTVQPGVYLDCTVGGGGHTQALLSAGVEQVIGLDQDPAALAAAQESLAPWGSRVQLHHGNFADYQPDQSTTPLFMGILADLGVSSAQLDRPERGFSFRQDGPLDMRMNPEQGGMTAADWVNHHAETELVEVFSRYGEEHFARRIARQIVQRRPFSRTLALAEVIWQAVPPAARHSRIHPATRVFQALRIVVNQELNALETLLSRAPDWLAPGGRMAIISFHSLEDRMVKWALRRDPRLTVVTSKPIIASDAECQANPRARSAKLRIAQKVLPSREDDA
ncbi:MAG: 16S rRNA (cytosine(1402)-N(4))-methyltransferase RsmH [Synechococcales cyanobacterium]